MAVLTTKLNARSADFKANAEAIDEGRDILRIRLAAVAMQFATDFDQCTGDSGSLRAPHIGIDIIAYHQHLLCF